MSAMLVLADAPQVLIALEQSALARAVSEGARRFRALLVLTAASRPTPPCGRCRQVLAEFAPDLPILLVTTGGRSERTDLAALYPRPFRR